MFSNNILNGGLQIIVINNQQLTGFYFPVSAKNNKFQKNGTKLCHNCLRTVLLKLTSFSRFCTKRWILLVLEPDISRSVISSSSRPFQSFPRSILSTSSRPSQNINKYTPPGKRRMGKEEDQKLILAHQNYIRGLIETTLL